MQRGGVPLQSENAPSAASEKSTSNKIDLEISARQAFRSPIFCNLICAMTCRSVAFTTVTTHFIPMMVWKSLSARPPRATIFEGGVPTQSSEDGMVVTRRPEISYVDPYHSSGMTGLWPVT